MIMPSHAVSLVLISGLFLSGCIGTHRTARNAVGTQDVTMTGSIGSTQASQSIAAQYESNPQDRATILAYAAALRGDGRSAEAVAVLTKAMLTHPKDKELAAIYGKALAENGQFETALNVIRDTQDPANPDWRLMNAEAAIEDQLGRPNEARPLYDRALTLAPGHPDILNNKAMSYLLTGDRVTAESILRQALAAPGASPRVRQNLALAVGLEGRYDEALSIAGSSVPPDVAASNIAYLKTVLANGGPHPARTPS